MHGINKYLKSAFIKNGVENFSFEVLEECSIDELNDKEKSYILKYNSFDRNFGYNQTTGGDCNYRQKSYKMSEETKRKISASRIGIKFSDEHKKKLSDAAKNRKKPTKGRKVLCIDTGKIYNTINEAKIETGAKKISDVCNGKRKTSNKLKFIYVEK